MFLCYCLFSKRKISIFSLALFDPVFVFIPNDRYLDDLAIWNALLGLR